MNRRDFIQSSAALLGAAALPESFARAAAISTDNETWRVFELTTRVEVLFPAGVTRVWLPVPLTSDTPWQKSLGNTWDAGNGDATFARDAHYAAPMLAVEWPASETKPVVEMKSGVATRERAIDFGQKPGKAPVLDAASRDLYLRATTLLPTDGIVRSTALKAAKGATR